MGSVDEKSMDPQNKQIHQLCHGVERMSHKEYPKSDMGMNRSQSDSTVKYNRERQLALWEGPTSSYNCFDINTRISVSNVKQTIEKVLKEMVEKEMVDYSVNTSSHIIDGRVFEPNAHCSFRLELFLIPSKKENDKRNCLSTKPVIEIRRMEGDGFVFQRFFDSLVEELVKLRLICGNFNHDNSPKHLDESMYLKDKIGMDLDQLDSWQLPIQDEDCDMSELDSSFEQTNTENELQRWLVSITDRNCNEEDIRDCTVEWLKVLEKGNHDVKKDELIEMMLNIFITNTLDKHFVVDELLSVISKDFYDAFCVRNILKIIHHLIKRFDDNDSNTGPFFQDFKCVETQISKIKKQWSVSSCVRFSTNCSFEFQRSQQIVKCCNACLDTIAAMS